MKRLSAYPKVATDLFLVQGSWTIWFFCIFILTQVIQLIFFSNSLSDSFFSAAYIAAHIYMLVIGIIGHGMITQFVSLGVTRKNFFKGAAIAAFALSLALSIATGAVNGVQYLIADFANLPVNIEGTLTDIMIEIEDENDHIIASIIKMLIIPPFIDMTNNWFIILLAFSLNIYFYYLIGWLISAGYYRYGSLFGFGFIILSLFFGLARNVLFGRSVGEPLASWLSLPTYDPPLYIIAVGNLLLISLILVIIQLMTKSVTIKM